MEDKLKTIEQWAQQSTESELPSWDELPSIPLYMDQIISYLGEPLDFFRTEDDPVLTNSMINNYVKSGVLPRPDKKKYRKEHLAALVSVCILKQILKLNEISDIFEANDIFCEDGVKGKLFYDRLLTVHAEAVHSVREKVKNSCESAEELRQLALELAVDANAKRLAAERILYELSE